MGTKSMATNIGDLNTKVAVIDTRLDNIESFMKRIDKAISGNGQPGLVQNLAQTEDKLELHITDYCEWKGRKEGADVAYKWTSGIVMAIISIIITIIAL